MRNHLKALVVFLLIMSTAKAQELFRLKESMGLPLRTRTYNNIKGSAFFLDTWSKGIVKQSNGQTIKDIDLKYDQIEDELMFRNTDGQELGFAVPVTEFKLEYTLNGSSKSSLFKNGFDPFKGSTEKNFYEILYEGPIKLAKKNVKRIEEYREYNSASVTKSVIERIKYYYYTADKLVEFKRDIKSVEVAFGDKSADVIKYIKQSNLNLKEDDDLIKVFSFYSNL